MAHLWADENGCDASTRHSAMMKPAAWVQSTAIVGHLVVEIQSGVSSSAFKKMTEIVVKRRKKGQHNQKTTPLHHLPRTELSKHIAAIKASADEFECSRNDEKEKRKKNSQSSKSIDNWFTSLQQQQSGLSPQTRHFLRFSKFWSCCWSCDAIQMTSIDLATFSVRA